MEPFELGLIFMVFSVLGGWVAGYHRGRAEEFNWGERAQVCTGEVGLETDACWLQVYESILDL